MCAGVGQRAHPENELVNEVCLEDVTNRDPAQEVEQCLGACESCSHCGNARTAMVACTSDACSEFCSTNMHRSKTMPNSSHMLQSIATDDELQQQRTIA